MGTYKGEIHCSYSDEYFYLGAHLSLEEARNKWAKYDGEPSDFIVEGIEHTFYRTGWLPADVNEDDEKTHGWWIVDEPQIMAGKATSLKIRRKKPLKEGIFTNGN